MPNLFRQFPLLCSQQFQLATWVLCGLQRAKTPFLRLQFSVEIRQNSGMLSHVGSIRLNEPFMDPLHDPKVYFLWKGHA